VGPEPPVGPGGPTAQPLADYDVSLGFVVCGGNVTQRDVRGWFDRLL
jgi:hypothetical protein